jgi:hypothetical protein
MTSLKAVGIAAGGVCLLGVHHRSPQRDPCLSKIPDGRVLQVLEEPAGDPGRHGPHRLELLATEFEEEKLVRPIC